MDGTMVDNATYHMNAWKKFAEKYGLILSDEDYEKKLSGKKNNAALEIVLNRELTSNEVDRYSEEKESLYRELYANEVKEVSGLTLLIQKIQRSGKKLAMATTSPKKNRDLVLTAINLTPAFEVIFGGEDVNKGKPDPEIYIKTATKLNVIPKSCLVFEDTPVGVAAGKNAGMSVVGVLNSHTKEDLSQADYFINDFTELL